MTGGTASRWYSALSALVGAWVIAAAFLFDLSTTQFVSDLAVGGVTVVAAGVAASRCDGDDDRVATLASAVAAVAGLWLLLAPLTFETTGLKLASDFFGGLVVAGTSGYVTWERLSTENAVRTGGHPAERRTSG